MADETMIAEMMVTEVTIEETTIAEMMVTEVTIEETTIAETTIAEVLTHEVQTSSAMRATSVMMFIVRKVVTNVLMHSATQTIELAMEGRIKAENFLVQGSRLRHQKQEKRPRRGYHSIYKWR